jgi:FtsH-binding integral membrane protein
VPRLAWYVALSLAVTTLAGWGWSLLIVVPVVGRLALSPVIGTAMLGLVGVALSRVGVRPDGAGAVVDLALTVVSGLVVGVVVSGRAAPPRRGAA